MKKPIMIFAALVLILSFFSFSDTNMAFINSDGNSEASSLESNKFLSEAKAAPTAPSGLAVATVNCTQILLTWTDNSGDEQGFKVERRVGADPYVQVGNAAANFAIQSPWTGTLSYLDKNLDPNTTYEYRICAYNIDGDSAYTASDSDTTYNYGDFYVSDDIVGNLRIVPGTDNDGFTQGSPTTEPCSYTDETEFTHILTRDLAVMPTEVTRQMWADLKTAQSTLPSDPSNTGMSSTMTHPVQNVTWYETVLFANILSLEQGLERVYYKDEALSTVVDSTNYSSGAIYIDPNADGFRLPTEGEWEHFTRAGTATPFWIDETNYDATTCTSSDPADLPYLATVAAYRGTEGRKPAQAAQYSANPWGLYDVHGNVWEFCWDLYGTYPTGTVKDYMGDENGTNRVCRGGSFIGYPNEIRSAVREANNPASRNNRIGFRLVRPVYHDHVYERDTIAENMIYVPETGSAGFTQGSPLAEDPDEGGGDPPCAQERETPQFNHQLTRRIIVMETEVTRKMWTKLRALQTTLPADPSHEIWSPGPNHPVNSITYREAILFANLLSAQQGHTPCYYADSGYTDVIDATDYLSATIYFDWDADGFRLPTEGEWEYFARAGTTGPFHYDEPAYNDTSCDDNNPTEGTLTVLDDIAVYRANSHNGSYKGYTDASASPVKSKLESPWNLYDIYGNVWERCYDGYHNDPEVDYPSTGQTDYISSSTEAARIHRGGGFWSRAEHCRSAVRYSYRAETAIGFRLVRTITLSKFSRKIK